MQYLYLLLWRGVGLLWWCCEVAAVKVWRFLAFELEANRIEGGVWGVGGELEGWGCGKCVQKGRTSQNMSSKSIFRLFSPSNSLPHLPHRLCKYARLEKETVEIWNLKIKYWHDDKSYRNNFWTVEIPYSCTSHPTYPTRNICHTSSMYFFLFGHCLTTKTASTNPFRQPQLSITLPKKMSSLVTASVKPHPTCLSININKFL